MRVVAVTQANSGNETEANGMSRICLIAGGGPAGLTAAYELATRTDVQPILFELSPEIGGLAKTVEYKGNRMDLGGHRFFTKSERVRNWWLRILPLQGAPARDDILLGRKVPLSTDVGAPDPETSDRVMLVRQRLSRIYFLRRFFEYPLDLSLQTIGGLGFCRTLRIGVSYVHARAFPIAPERTLEDFFINRFGRELYATFFKDYTEKVWGLRCDQIKPEWGAQRIKGLSVSSVLWHAIRGLLWRDQTLRQDAIETSLIGQFMYPKFGPGQLWQEVAKRVEEAGGQIRLRQRVTAVHWDGLRVVAADVESVETGQVVRHSADFFISTMPVRELLGQLTPAPPASIAEVAAGLVYRDFLTVGLLVRCLVLQGGTKLSSLSGTVLDNWIYIQDGDVRVGRVQIYNNWSPYMVENSDYVWLGLEYFCNEGDSLWATSDEDLVRLGIEELQHIGIIRGKDVLDGTVARALKAYPAYTGTYDRLGEVRDFVDGIENMFLIGRNGMHRYNNQDHSMLTAMLAVDLIAAGRRDKTNIWTVNSESDYHESQKLS